LDRSWQRWGLEDESSHDRIEVIVGHAYREKPRPVHSAFNHVGIISKEKSKVHHSVGGVINTLLISDVISLTHDIASWCDIR
jgi:hypothetical protein